MESTRRLRLVSFATGLIVLLAAGFVSGPVEARPPFNDSSLIGTWVNAKTDEGLVKVVVTGGSGTLFVHPYGACSPLCDWGTHSALGFSSGVGSGTAMGFHTTIQFTFKNVYMQGHLIRTPQGQVLLEITTQSQFIRDVRNDYELIEDFKKQ